MNKSITQDTQNDNQISKTIRRFFITTKRLFHWMVKTEPMF